MAEEIIDKKIDNIPEKSAETIEMGKASLPEKEKNLAETIAAGKQEMEKSILPTAMGELDDLEKMLDNNGANKEEHNDFADKKDEVKERIGKAKEEYLDMTERLKAMEDENAANTRIEDAQNELGEIIKDVEFIKSSRNKNNQEKEEEIDNLRERYGRLFNSPAVQTHLDKGLDWKNVEAALDNAEKNLHGEPQKEDKALEEEKDSGNKINIGNNIQNKETLSSAKTREEVIEEANKINDQIEEAFKKGSGLGNVDELKRQREELFDSLGDRNDDFGSKIGEKIDPKESNPVPNAQEEKIESGKMDVGIDNDSRKTNEKITRELGDKESPLSKAMQRIKETEYEISNLEDRLKELR